MNQTLPDPSSTPGTTTPEANASRRRFLTIGLVATPIIMTLAARPARAQSAMGSLGAYDYQIGTPGELPIDTETGPPSDAVDFQQRPRR